MQGRKKLQPKAASAWTLHLDGLDTLALDSAPSITARHSESQSTNPTVLATFLWACQGQTGSLSLPTVFSSPGCRQNKTHTHRHTQL